MNNDDSMREHISALADGQLPAEGKEATARLIGQICEQEALRSTWHTYHLVGDVLRSGTHTACADSGEFVARLRQRLVVEALPLSSSEPLAAVARVEAANEPVFRWKMLAGVASVAAAAAIGWNWIGTPQGPTQAQLAQQAPATAVASSAAPSTSMSPSAAPSSTRILVGEGQRPQVMLRDPRLDALLEAHQQAGGASTMPSAFLRNATFEAPSR